MLKSVGAVHLQTISVTVSQVHSRDDHVQPGHTGDCQTIRAAHQRAGLHDSAAVHRELCAD